MIKRIILSACLLTACIWCLVSVARADLGSAVRAAPELGHSHQALYSANVLPVADP
jgi:hypothetical protein